MINISNSSYINANSEDFWTNASVFIDKKRQGGDRAQNTATVWANILARRELGESLKAIAIDLNMPYETVRKYAQAARKAIGALEKVP